MIAKDNLLLSQQTYTYQKALAVPDITVGPITFFTQSSNYIPDETFYAFGFSIPIFNRNQGNIKNARILIDYNNTQVDLTQKTLEDQVTRGLQKAIDADKLYKGIDLTFAANFDTLASEMMKNYMKRNVNLLTFLTFYDSYKQNIVQFNTISYNKVNALENMNFLTGTNFFNK
jgi:cobalt-zinc-cadmium efflux system outer membrane protein